MFLVDHCDLYKSIKEHEKIYFCLAEDNYIPFEAKCRIVSAHIFPDELTIFEFPLRANFIFLQIKRRRLLD